MMSLSDSMRLPRTSSAAGKAASRPSGYVFTRELRGVKQAVVLDAALLASAEARRLDEHAAALNAVYAKPAMLCARARKCRSPVPARCWTR